MAKIFIVEDDNVHVFLMRHALEQVGHEIDVIQDVTLFEEEVYDIQPDLIIMDLNLPQRDGLSLVHDLRQIPDLCDIPVVVVTARSLTGIQMQMVELGCLGFVSKPFNPEKLQDSVNGVLLGTT